jgi:inorganic pyrophosphatase
MINTTTEFWESLDQMVSACQVVIDRQEGTAHPRYSDMIYPVDYGYLEGTSAIDGSGIDIWIGTQGIGKVQGMLCTVDVVKRDAEIKLLCGCTKQEIDQIMDFLNQHRMSLILVKRWEGQ